MTSAGGEAFVFLDILPVALKVEDQGKVVFPKTVIEITIVTDLLEAFRKHVEQETLHKLQRSDGKCPDCLPSSPRAVKTTLSSSTETIRESEIATL